MPIVQHHAVRPERYQHCEQDARYGGERAHGPRALGGIAEPVNRDRYFAKYALSVVARASIVRSELTAHVYAKFSKYVSHGLRVRQIGHAHGAELFALDDVSELPRLHNCAFRSLQ